MKQDVLREILDKHNKWLNGEDGGEYIDANLRDADLRGTDLQDVNLRDVDLRGANLRGANLRGADLRGANFSGANLQDADLQDANLSGAILSFANLRNADLSDADLCFAYLSGADLCFAKLSGADLRFANLRNTDLTHADYTNTVLSLQCPEEGSFIAWKKLKFGVIAKLLIPEDAKRSSATTRKCRASKAIVLAIYYKNGEPIEEACSQHDGTFIYRVGETVYPDHWDEDRWNECSNGIHFFITRKEAEKY